MHDDGRPERPLGVSFLAFLIFYEVSGGPFGIEGAVGAGGPLLALLGFAALPFVWSVPEALLTAELAVAFPENSGYVVWVKEAFGERLAFLEGLLKWTSGVVDNAVYPLLFLEYFDRLPSVSLGKFQWPTAALLAVGLAYFNWRGLKLVGKVAAFLCIFSLLPFGVLVLIGLPRLKFERLGIVDFQKVEWTPFLNVLFWNLNYWEAVSTLAGEVHNPTRTFPRALAFACALVIAGYSLPLLVGIGATRDDLDEWKEGHFSRVAKELGGTWLEIWVVVVAAASNIGLFEAEMSSDSFLLSGMADRGLLPHKLATRSRFGTPTYAIILSSLGIACLATLTFSQVLELLNFLYCVAALLEFSAFLHLRWTRPQLFNKFRLPLSTPWMAVFLFPATVLIAVVIVIASWPTYLAASVIIVLGLFGHPLVRLADKKRWCRFAHHDEPASEPLDGEGQEMSEPIVEMGSEETETRRLLSFRRSQPRSDVA